MQYKIQYLPIDQLILNSENPRLIRDAGFKRLVKSLKDCPSLFDARPCICSNRTGQNLIMGGNMRYLAAKELKYKKVPTIIMSGLTPEQEREIAIKDNGTEFGEWNMDLLSAWSDLPLVDWGVPLPEDWLAAPTGEPADAEPQIDRAEELNKIWKVKAGDLFQIGSHKLLCGDSTKAEDVARVMGGEKADMVFTDPPYGVELNPVNIGGWGKIKKTDKIIGDKDTTVARGFWQIVFGWDCPKVIWGGNYFTDFLPLSPHWIVWNKLAFEKHEQTFSHCELAWTNAPLSSVRMYSHVWDGAFRAGSEKDEGKSRVHSAQRPVGLTQKIIMDYVKDEIIADPFLGSGTTMVACQNLNRKCMGIEISPDYCAVILQRMTDAFPGIEIRRLKE